MLKDFDKNQLNFLNEESGGLIDLISIEDFKPKPSQPQEPSSLKDQGFSIKLSNVKNIKETNQGGIKQEIDGKVYSLSPEHTARFSKFVKRILSIENVNGLISGQFIANETWNWLIDKVRNQTTKTFGEFIINEMKLSIREYKFHFFLINLNIVLPFNIGNVEFGYFSIEWLEKYIQMGILLHPEKKKDLEDFKETQKGQVYVSATVSAEKEKAEDIALIDCSLAMDIVKISSNTLDYPSHKLSFDIDSRAVENPSSKTISFDLKDFDGMIISCRNSSFPLYLNKDELKKMDERKIGRFITLYADFKQNPTELKKLVIQGVQRLASALSNKSYHQRVTELFTILESLLLIDERTPIISSVSKYTSLLLYKERSDREKIIKFLKDMYSIRSAWVHHAKEKEIKLSDLKLLQRKVHQLLWVLIEKSRTHNTKKELLTEIESAVDDAIMNAYK